MRLYRLDLYAAIFLIHWTLFQLLSASGQGQILIRRFQAPLSARESTNEQEIAELARCQQNLERAYQEKRALEMLVQQLRKQLVHVSFTRVFGFIFADLGFIL